VAGTPARMRSGFAVFWCLRGGRPTETWAGGGGLVSWRNSRQINDRDFGPPRLGRALASFGAGSAPIADADRWLKYEWPFPKSGPPEPAKRVRITNTGVSGTTTGESGAKCHSDIASGLLVEWSSAIEEATARTNNPDAHLEATKLRTRPEPARSLSEIHKEASRWNVAQASCLHFSGLLGQEGRHPPTGGLRYKFSDKLLGHGRQARDRGGLSRTASGEWAEQRYGM